MTTTNSPKNQFASDNYAGICPEAWQALQEADCGYATSYGDDPWTNRLDSVYSDLFETPVRVFPITTGTAANVTSLSHACPPWGAVFCHHESHVQVDECGAFEFYSGGAKLIPLPGDHGRISPEALEQHLQDILRFSFRNLDTLLYPWRSTGKVRLERQCYPALPTYYLWQHFSKMNLIFAPILLPQSAIFDAGIEVGESAANSFTFNNSQVPRTHQIIHRTTRMRRED